MFFKSSVRRYFWIIFASLGCLIAFQNFSFPGTTVIGIFRNAHTLPRNQHLALVSLQGLANRTNKQIYINNGNNETDWLANKVYNLQPAFQNATNYTTLQSIITAYKTSAAVAGVVIWNPQRPFTLNVATNLAGVRNLLIFSPDMVPLATSLNLPIAYNLVNMFNDSSSEPENIYLAQRWVYDNFYAEQSQEWLANYYYGDHLKMYDGERDYAIQKKIHVFWLPGKTGEGCDQNAPNDPEYSANLQAHTELLFTRSPKNIGVLGFWPSLALVGNVEVPRGYCEFNGVKFAGLYGKYSVVTGFSSNFSFHSRQTSSTSWVQTAPRQKTFRTYNPNKKYVAFIMQESGDSPGYMEYNFSFNQWSDPKRGQVPISYGITPQMAKLAPAMVEYLYATATPNDFFYSAISGNGYSYPFLDYGLRGTNINGVVTTQSQIVSDYFQKTSVAMQSMDLDMLGFYSDVLGNSWKPEWDVYLNTKVTPQMPGLKAIIADMGRLEGINGENSYSLLNNGTTSLFHSMTKWNLNVGGEWYVTPFTTPATYDSAASQWLINEIQNNSSGQFIQAMALSWHYGPTRLKMVQDALMPLGYEFVTLNEFNDLYRQSLKYAVVTSSGVWNDHPSFTPNKAIDADLNVSRWASQYDNSPVWIKLDLGTVKIVKAATIKWELAGTYRIDVSTDNVNWITVNSGTAANNSTTIGAFGSSGAWARYVRVSPNSNSDTQYRSIYDITLTFGFGKIVTTASGVYDATGNYSADKAADGIANTRWASNYLNNEPVWIKLDLGVSKLIKTATIKWEYAGSYRIEVSTDNTNWTSLTTGTAATNATTVSDFGTGRWGRYIRISPVTANEIQYRSIHEITLTYGGEVLTTSSGFWNNDPSFSADKAVDNLIATRWASNTTGATWLKLDYGSIKPISSVRISWEYIGSYKIEISNDDLNWTSISTGNVTAYPITTTASGSWSARYIRIAPVLSTDYQYRSIFEVVVTRP